LRPSVLDDLGLIPALESHIQAFTARTHLPVAFDAFPGVEKLDSTKRTALYRIAQEALTNIARHAKASQVTLHISGHKDAVLMEITDNGRGFSPEKALLAARGKRLRLGMLGKRERAEMIDGTFLLASAPGKGTTVRVEIPLAGSPAKKSPKRKPASPRPAP